MYEMIVTDLDGTLLNEKSRVSSFSKERLRYYKSKNYKMVVATGRTLESVIRACEEIDMFNYIITNNGSNCYDVFNDKYLFINKIDESFISYVFSIYTEEFKYVEFRDLNKIYRFSKKICECPSYIIPISSKDDIQNISIMHISLVFKNNEIANTMFNKIKELNFNIEITLMQDSYCDDLWIDVVPIGVNKFNSVIKLANILNIKENNIIAFGDGLNDICMIENLEHGIAIKSALDDVKMSAKDITKYSNTQDGVVKYLDDLL